MVSSIRKHNTDFLFIGNSLRRLITIYILSRHELNIKYLYVMLYYALRLYQSMICYIQNKSKEDGHMELRVLQYFLAVAREQSISGAAESLFLSQPTLATVYKGNIIKNLIMDCQSYTKYRPNEMKCPQKVRQK